MMSATDQTIGRASVIGILLLLGSAVAGDAGASWTAFALAVVALCWWIGLLSMVRERVREKRRGGAKE